MAQGDALAHAGAVRGPVADVVLGLAVVPADKVQLTLPAAGTLAQHGYTLDNFVFDLCHIAKPAFMFVCFYNKGSAARFQQVN